jgi:hypothetical protein
MSADFSDGQTLQDRLTLAADKLSSMTGDVAVARQVVNFDSDRRKRALAIAAAPLLAAGNTNAGADTEARASGVYAAAMKQLGEQYAAAEKVLAEWEATKIQFECARSLLSAQKAAMQSL